MLYECKCFFEEYNHLLPKKYAGRFFLYMAFVISFCRKFGKKINDGDGWAGFLKKNVPGIYGYEVKEAILAFEAYMPWLMLEGDKRLYDAFGRLFTDLCKKTYADDRWLIDTAEGILSNYEGYTATPKSIRRAAAEYMCGGEIGQIVDLCCGGYFFGLEIYTGSAQREKIVCCGEERDPYLCAVAGMLLFLCNATGFNIKEKNVLYRAEYPRVNEMPRVFAADLPLSGNRTIPVPSGDEFLADNKRTLYADWFVMYNVLEEMVPGDRAVFIVTKGALVRENERFLRKHYIKNDCIDAVIALPRGIYPKSRLPMEMIFFEKGRPAERCGKVLIADLTDCEPDALEEKISGMRCGEILAEAKFVSAEEIAERDFELNPRIYLAGEEKMRGGLTLGDVACVTRGLQNTSAPNTYSEERYLLNIRDIQRGEILCENSDKIRGGTPVWEDKYLIREDDIILTAKGASMKIAIVPPNPPKAYISGNLMIIRVNPERYSAYVLYEYLVSDAGQRALGLIQTGTTIRVIGTKKLQQLPIPEYENMTAVGDGLKLAGINYRRTVRETGESFERKKKELLGLLK